MKIPSVYDENNNLVLFFQDELDKNNFKVKEMLLSNTSFLNLVKKENLQYVADFSEKQNLDLSMKKIKFMLNKKDGNLIAMFINSDNSKINSNINLKKVNLNKIEIRDINNIIIQQTLNSIIKELEELKEEIQAILAGQHNDRLAKAKNAFSQYLTLEYIDDLNTRRIMVQNIINISSESFFQLAETLKYTIYKFKSSNDKTNGLKDFIESGKRYMTNKNINLADDIFMQLEALIYSSMIRTMAYSKLDNQVVAIMPMNDLHVFLDSILDKDMLYLINSWTEKHPNFWTNTYINIKENIKININTLENDINELLIYKEGGS